MTTSLKSKDQKSVLLKVEGLRIEGYSDEKWIEIVHGVDLTLHRGEVLGLIGESGAGKSTIGLAAMGYARGGCRISGGSVEFDGMELTTSSESELRALRGSRIAYVAQSAAASFNPAHKLIDQHIEAPLEYRLKRKPEAMEDAMELYNKLRLPNPDEIGFRFPHQVSGGQLQRAMTAMAMSCRPDLIIFDEPTTALDVTTQIEVLSAIRDIVDQFNTAAIYITHDLAVVAQMADRIKVLLKGDEVEEADTVEMLENPKEDYTKSLWAVRSFKRDQKSRPKGEEPVISVENVHAAYGDTKVLEDVSFDVHAGMTVAVVGESGSGKSTAARVITGLLPPTEGRILFRGEELPPRYKSRSKEQLRQIQMIYQMADTALNPKVQIYEIIGRPAQFYSGLKGTALKNRIDELLDLIELEPVTILLSLPPGVVRRPEAAHRHRPRPGSRAELHHLRRGDLRARPAGGRGDPQAARPAATRAQPRLHVHHPRSGDGARHCRRGGGDEAGPGGGVRGEDRDVHAPAPSLHRSPALIGAGDGPELAGQRPR